MIAWSALRWLADALDPATLTRDIQTGGVIFLLVLFVVGFIRQWWVPGWVYKESLAREEQLKQRAMRGTILAEEAVDTAAEQAASRRLAEDATRIAERAVRKAVQELKDGRR